MTRDGTYTYTWDAVGRLITVTDGITTLGFLYDGDGNRLARSVNGTLTTHTLDVGLSLPEVLVEHDEGDVTRYLHLPTGVATDDGAWTYSAADGLGSVRQRLDASGQVAAVNGYRPFGSPLEGDGGEPYGFTGEWWEADLNLLYLRARWYAPSQGRFLSEDSIPGFAERPLTQHLWLYALDNPVHYIDPSGHQVQPPDCKPGDICATGTFGPYTPSLPAYGYEPPEPVPHYYNRQAAVNYALRYACGANYNYYKLSVDCTNFVSQALAAGGLPMTPKWRAQQELLAQLLSRLGFGFPRGCGSDPWDAPCTPAWSAAPDLYSYLKNYLGYPSYNLPKVEQAAKDSDTPPPNMANSPIPIQPGDVVFYRNEEHTEFNHTALVIGWGPPSYFQNEKKDQDCSADLPGEWSNVFNPESDRLPWIIDHGGPNYKRAFNDIGSTNEVEFVHIPDFLGEW